MVGLVTSKNEDSINYKSSRKKIVAKGQVTLKQKVLSGPKSNLSEMFWLSLLPARKKKKIQSKMKALEWPQHIISLWEKFHCSRASNSK